MATFKHKNGGVAVVFTKVNINRLRADKNYREVKENGSDEVLNTKKDKDSKEVEQPLQ